VEIGHAAAYYWAGKAPATQFFTTVPFGMNAQQANAWLYSGGGLQLWEELYANFNLIPMPVGNTGVQMGGWFNKEITSIKDFKGLKMRMPGLGGKVIDKAGAAVTLSPVGEIYTNLERGVIDATEWVGPYHDYLLGLHKVAKYYYYPGWHEPGSVLEIFINKGIFEKLPGDLQHIIRTAAGRSNVWMLSAFEAQNNAYLQKLIQEHQVQLKRFPDDVIQTLKTYAQEVLGDITAKDPMSKKVYDSYRKFQSDVSAWAETSEKAFYSYMS
jgi:TRAP-type mannitol/chloroaromatic compound transport system substrate-binding protein